MDKMILNMRVDITSLSKAVKQIGFWVSQKEAHYVCISNVHMCMECFDNDEFCKVVNGADLVVPDGKPLVWVQKILGEKDAQQVRGMDLMLALCGYAEKTSLSIGFYGSTPRLLSKLEKNLKISFPALRVVCSLAPPFRPLLEQERMDYIDIINESGVEFLFVGIGCPKQEKWMAENKTKLKCTMLGVGAAFDFIAGEKRHAPLWMQSLGLEWLFRLLSEPRRLWKRYLKHNPRFVWYISKQIMYDKFKV